MRVAIVGKSGSGKSTLAQQIATTHSHAVDRAFVHKLAMRWYADGVDDRGLRFEACTITKREWTHAAHLAIRANVCRGFGRGGGVT